MVFFSILFYALLFLIVLATKITSTTSATATVATTTTHYCQRQCHLPPTNLQATQHRNGNGSDSSWGPGPRHNSCRAAGMFSLLQVCFSHYIYFNYTNKCLKVLYLWVEKSGVAVEMEDGDWDLGRAWDVSCLEPRVCFSFLSVITILTMCTVPQMTATGARDEMCLKPQPQVSLIYHFFLLYIF